MRGGNVQIDVTCGICGDDLGVDTDGEPFVACLECHYPVCRPCYEYELKEGNQACPKCKATYRRLKGNMPIMADVEGHNDGEFREEDPYNEQVGREPVALVIDESLPPARGDFVQMNGHPYEGYLYPESQMDAESLTASDYQSTVNSGQPAGERHRVHAVPFAASPDGHGTGTPISARGLDSRGSDTGGQFGYGSVAWKERVESWKQRQEKLQLMTANGDIQVEKDQKGLGGEPPKGIEGSAQEGPSEAEARQPLSRIVDIPSTQLGPYRISVIVRLVILGFFLRFRLTNPVKDALGLWVTSIICEIWFALSWILDQFPKWMPINRETFLDRLSARFERGAESRLAAVDLFVSTVDPWKEPPITTANTILSILAMDYPTDKISCYLSDDGASILTFEALQTTAEFARLWVPFCKKFNIEPRAPDMYFGQTIDYLKDKRHRDFVKERREIKREFEEFKVRINALVAKAEKVPEDGWTMHDGSPWPGNNSRDHPGMIQVFLGASGGVDVNGNTLPRLVYVSREKRPGYNHHKKAGAMNALVRVSAVLTNAPYILNLDCDHYINNCQALREAMCFMMDPNVGRNTCYVQFPQRFDGIDRSDRYANHNTVFFDINMPGLDGLQGPVYVGTGCCFRRHSLYGYDAPPSAVLEQGTCCGPRKSRRSSRAAAAAKLDAEAAKMMPTADGVPVCNVDDLNEDGEGEQDSLMALKQFGKRFGQSLTFVVSTLQEEGGVALASPQSAINEAIHVISCGYEGKTDWGKELGWIYGSVTEDILTGFKMQCRGWRSIYCMPKRPAFKGSAPINLSDRLQQVLRWALGSVEIFLSRHCPIWYSYGRLNWLQRLAYINTVVYPFTSFPLVAYCCLPAICLITDKFIIPEISGYATLWFIALFLSIFVCAVLEMRWAGVGMEEWWRNEQFWVIGGTSAHLYAVFQGLLKVLAGIDTNFTVTAKANDEGGDFSELYLVKWTSLLIPPTTLIVINLIGIIAGLSQAINSGVDSWGPLFGKLFFALWVIVHLYPFLKGLMGRSNGTPTIVIVWAILLASIFSLLWVKINPFISTTTSMPIQQCGLNC